MSKILCLLASIFYIILPPAEVKGGMEKLYLYLLVAAQAEAPAVTGQEQKEDLSQGLGHQETEGR